jgi:hypothetical protein
VGGVKIPKVLRKSKSVDTLLNNPLGRELLAGALVAGAGAVASALTKHRHQLADAGSAVVDTGSAAASATHDAVHGAASSISGALRDLASRLSSQNNGRKLKKDAGKKKQSFKAGARRELGTNA